MQTFLREPTLPRTGGVLTALCAALLLSACGGGDGNNGATAIQVDPAPVASGITTLLLDMAELPDEVAAQSVQPAFHMAPVLLDTPDDADGSGDNMSAHRHPRQHAVPADSEGIPTRQLTPQLLEETRRGYPHKHPVLDLTSPNGAITPMASSLAVSTYSPAQIRAAYGLSTLPAAGTSLNAAQAAQLGAGQTIYIVDAKHNPNVATELTAFNQKFGLPTCTTQAIAITAALPLPVAPVSGCRLSIVYNTTAGGMTSAVPAYDSGWASEISLDVQWAHATAPLARIVLIEASDASINNLLGGIKLANAMGPGAVSMSFGALEGSWTSSVDGAFTGNNMTYLAATGDSGAAVSWPAVSTKVIAVGGTSLTYSGTGTRSETVWSGTGGGTSLYTPKPSYQSTAVPGMGAYRGRTVADVAFNADPYTGQYVALMAPGSTTVKWMSMGGTSLATPQWAGLIAIANATRALSAKAALGSPHAILYGQIATVPGTYASAFADITQGLNGTCAICISTVGYDMPSGLGTPNVSSLVNALAGVATPPLVSSASISGKLGSALTFTASVTAPNAVTYTLTGAPSGMGISSAGIVSWATPVAGTYSVTVTAKDTKTNLSGQGVYTVTIAAQSSPAVATATVSGKPAVALSFTVSVTASNPVTYTLTNAPSGMSIAGTGVVSWAKPVLGTYSVTVSAKDSKTSLSGQGVYTVKIANTGPVMTAPATAGVAGKALSGTISITDPGATSLSISIADAPLGMRFSTSGLTMTYSWASPVVGSYKLKVSVVDNLGLSAQTTVAVTVTAK